MKSVRRIKLQTQNEKIQNRNENAPVAGGVSRFRKLLQEQFFEQQDPDAVDPADEHAQESYDQTDDQSDRAAFFEKGGPPDDDLDDPVDDRDQQQYELNETALSVKPSHCLCLLIELEFLPLIIIYHIFPFRNVCDKSFTYLCDKKHMGINAAGAYRGQTPKATCEVLSIALSSGM